MLYIAVILAADAQILRSTTSQRELYKSCMDGFTKSTAAGNYRNLWHVELPNCWVVFFCLPISDNDSGPDVQKSLALTCVRFLRFCNVGDLFDRW